MYDGPWTDLRNAIGLMGNMFGLCGNHHQIADSKVSAKTVANFLVKYAHAPMYKDVDERRTIIAVALAAATELADQLTYLSLSNVQRPMLADITNETLRLVISHEEALGRGCATFAYHPIDLANTLAKRMASRCRQDRIARMEAHWRFWDYTGRVANPDLEAAFHAAWMIGEYQAAREMIGV